MTLTSRKRQFIVLIIIVGISLILLVVYFFIYVKDKEDYVNRRNFKELAKSAQNIRQKIQVYRTRGITKNLFQHNLEFVLKKYFSDVKQGSIDILRDSLKAEVEREKSELSLDSFHLIDPEKSKATGEKRTSFNGQLELLNGVHKFVFRDILRTLKDRTSIGCGSCDTLPCEEYLVASSISVDQFIKPLLQADIFNEFVLVDFPPKNIFYESHPLGAADSIKSILKSFKDEIQINGTYYKIFPFKFSEGEKEWVLVGLQNLESYLDETRNFDRSVLYTIILISLILLISLPWIKVILMSKNEKLNRMDVTLCGFSILLGCFLWTIIIISFDYNYLFKQDAQGSHLQQLASEVENRFNQEVDSAFRELQIADKSFQQLDVVDLNEEINRATSCADTVVPSIAYRPGYNGVELIFWIDSHGKQQYKWATGKKNTRKIDVSGRTYYARARDNSGWPWPGIEEIDTQKIVLESIRSWNTAEARAVISMPRRNETFRVVAIQILLRSVIDCVLPPGYKFCIADQDGKVWFHSDSERNLRENIFEECDLKYDLNNILFNKGEESTVIYENKKHDLFIKPLEKFPLFLITMKDLALERRSRAYIMELTFILVLGQVMLIMLTIIIIWLTWTRSLKVYATHRSPDWLKPDDRKISDYVKISLMNVVIAVLFVLTIIVFDFSHDICIFLLIPLYILPAYYLYLNNQTPSDYFKPVNRALIYSVLFLIVCVNLVVINLYDAVIVILYQIILLLLIFAWLALLHRKMIPFRRKLIVKFGYQAKTLKDISLRTAYSLAVSSLFVVIAVIPAFEFNRQAFNLERLKDLMAMQYGTVKEVLNKPKNTSVYLMGGTEKYPQNEPRESLAKHPAFHKLSTLMSPVMGTFQMGFLTRGGKFHTYVEDRSWKWSSDGTANIYFTVNSFEGSKKLFPLRSFAQQYDSPGPFGWIAAMLGLLFLFLFARYLITRIFIFDISRNLVEADIHLITAETKRKSIIDARSDEPLFNNHLFIIGLPFSGKRDYIDKLHPPVKTNRFFIDLVDLDINRKWNTIIPGKDELEKYEVILVDHFEYDFQNTSCNNSKLLLLEKLFLLWKKKIVILSTIHPAQVLDQYRDDIKYSERWSAVLSHFYKIFYPLDKVELSKSQIMEEFKIDEVNWELNQHYYKFIESECSYGLFLQNLRPTMYSLVEKANKDQLNVEELSSKVKSLAYTYYASIWASCSKDERFLIYDLAEDGLVNVKNSDSIIRLIYKGIFRQHRTLSIMNRSFRNFVLSYVTREEVLAMREETLTHGTWSSIKGPILFVLVIALLFLLYTQRGLASEIMAFLGALVAAIPVFLRSFASVDSPSRTRSKH